MLLQILLVRVCLILGFLLSAFALLPQKFPDKTPVLTCISDAVPRGQPSNRSPQVRTIPVQIEGNGDSQPYVHPSQQTVPEPRKYTGSSIPSRSFKILQAMTAPSDACGKVHSEYVAFCNGN